LALKKKAAFWRAVMKLGRIFAKIALAQKDYSALLTKKIPRFPEVPEESPTLKVGG
jgi:hypothetical protein